MALYKGCECFPNCCCLGCRAAATHSATGTSGSGLSVLFPCVFKDGHRLYLTADLVGVWMYMLQGSTMIFGMSVIFSLMLCQTEGLKKATRLVANMTPTEHGVVSICLETADNRDVDESFHRQDSRV